MQEVSVRSSHNLPLQLSPVTHHPSSQLSMATASTGGTSGTSSNSSSSACRAGSRGSSRNSSLGDSDETPTHQGEEVHCSPMDLSSAASNTVPAAVMKKISGRTTDLEVPSPLLDPRRLADLVKAQEFAQQLQKQQQSDTTTSTNDSISRIPKKRQWPRTDEEMSSSIREQLIASAKGGPQQKEPSHNNQDKAYIPLDMIKEKWSNQEERTSPDSGASSCSNSSPLITSGSNGREIKKRRLDALLNQKFCSASPPPPAPAPSHEESSPVQPQIPSSPITSRRGSNERKSNRRKQSNPNNNNNSSSTLPTLAVKPNSELFPKKEVTVVKKEVCPTPDQDAAATAALKGQILQLQLAQAALLSSPTSDILKAASPGAAGNPLLYYGYYAQMLQGLQAQQHKLVEELVSKQQKQAKKAKEQEKRDKHHTKPIPNEMFKKFLKSDKSGNNNGNKLGAAANGFKAPKLETPEKLAPSFENPLSPLLPFNFAPKSPSSLPSPTSSVAAASPRLPPHLSPLPVSGLLATSQFGGAASDEPRRRAPRALTGRHVKSGTGASKHILEILRKKIVERMKLKELLGENSHLYFGALNKQKKGIKNGQKK